MKPLDKYPRPEVKILLPKLKLEEPIKAFAKFFNNFSLN